MRLSSSSGLTVAFMMDGDLSEESLQILFGQNAAGGSTLEIEAPWPHLT